MQLGASPSGERQESNQQTILLVDDTPQNLMVIGELLQPLYRVRAVSSGERALRAVHSLPRPDLILLDVMMPVMDGYAVMRQLRDDPLTRDIPVIFITALNTSEDEERGLELGAVDYITKPINPAIVLARVRTQLELKAARDRLADENSWLEQEVARRMQENLLVQELTVRALACLAEARDNETGNHIIRTQAYVEVLARRLSGHPRFRDALGGERLGLVSKAAPLHDIGKVGIPDAILLKPGKLSEDEFAIMKTHPSIGAAAIDKAIEQVRGAAAGGGDGAFTFLLIAREISLSHHERWDGSGYPQGLAGDAIPVPARLMALADVFDALINRRVYKPPLSLPETVDIIMRGRGEHFDPDVVDAFVACQDDFARIAERFSDPA